MIIDRTNEYLERLERAAMGRSRLARARETVNAFAGRILCADTTDPRAIEATIKLRVWSDRTVYGPLIPYPWPWLVN